MTTLTEAETGTRHHYVECGLDYVWLEGGFVREETAYGPAVRVEHASALDRAIAEAVVRHRRHLTGQEVRFLRGLMDLTQEGLAALLGKDAQSVARWERARTRIPPTEDRALRQLFLEHAGSAQSFTETARRTAAIRGEVVALSASGGEGGSWRVAAERP
ncbi:helix-turn-helix domain-containing protein [Rhodocista pekingensis]|uniref:Helix-turn-helix domain-containing protein n=1 Tax=Rhodocista pekingensis TaxID=201185 RepID=A0ABW2KTH9_9PROT